VHLWFYTRLADATVAQFQAQKLDGGLKILQAKIDLNMLFISAP
jgi:hypothetical protein